jgi:ubiquinone/menaquinone biosynthesis C-methylase UbiE
VFDLPFEAATFDGVFNLGVLEHFGPAAIHEMLREFYRILKPGGRLVVFWPHRWSASVMILTAIHAGLRLVGRDRKLHPDEISLLASRGAAERTMAAAGFTLVSYGFGPRDFFVQSVVVAAKPAYAGRDLVRV